jgi:hypothetical protein
MLLDEDWLISFYRKTSREHTRLGDLKMKENIRINLPLCLCTTVKQKVRSVL